MIPVYTCTAAIFTVATRLKQCMSFGGRMDRPNVVYVHSGVLFSLNHFGVLEQGGTLNIMLSEKSQ